MVPEPLLLEPLLPAEEEDWTVPILPYKLQQRSKDLLTWAETLSLNFAMSPEIMLNYPILTPTTLPPPMHTTAQTEADYFRYLQTVASAAALRPTGFFFHINHFLHN